MIEYRITIPSRLKTIKTLWRLFLKNDPRWHFTLEGDYIELRVSKQIPAMDAYLIKKNWQYTTFVYKDNIDITRKYQPFFEQLFHVYAQLSMKFPDKLKDWKDNKSDINCIAERCFHLFYNLLGADLGQEAVSLNSVSWGRTYMFGKMSGEIALPEKKEENERK